MRDALNLPSRPAPSASNLEAERTVCPYCKQVFANILVPAEHLEICKTDMENQENKAIAEAVRAFDRAQERNAIRVEAEKIAFIMATVTADARFEALTASRAMDEIMVHGKREIEKMAEEAKLDAMRALEKAQEMNALRAHAENFAQGIAFEPQHAGFAPGPTAVYENAAPEMEIDHQNADSDDLVANMFIPTAPINPYENETGSEYGGFLGASNPVSVAVQYPQLPPASLQQFNIGPGGQANVHYHSYLSAAQQEPNPNVNPYLPMQEGPLPIVSKPSRYGPAPKPAGNDRIPCTLCNLTFDKPAYLKQHMKFHNGEFQCPECQAEGIEYHATQSSYLNRHRETQHGVPRIGKPGKSKRKGNEVDARGNEEEASDLDTEGEDESMVEMNWNDLG